MSPVPEQGVAIVLRDQRGGGYRSEVLESYPRHLLLDPPADSAAADSLRPGSRLLVTWPDQQSLWVLPVMVVPPKPGDQAKLVTEVDGDAWREERRHYVRAAIEATVHIDYAGSSALGELIDLSEVAMRCIVAPEHQALSQPRTEVTVRLDLSGNVFEIPGHVLVGKPAARLDLGLELVVLFQRPVARVDEMRVVLADAKLG